MSDKKKKPRRVKARLPRGFADRSAGEIRATEAMIGKIREVYERYGFDPVETPMFEYTDALGKFLPDADRPNEGVFSLKDDDEQWMSLRYDLTAPLARHVAENINTIQLPYRTWRAGWVFRNEKPGPGRFRQFMQLDADTIGTGGGAASVAADAEMAMMLADAMEAVGIARGDYVVRVNNRKVLDGVMEHLEIPAEKRTEVLRAIDKKDRLGIEEVRKLLGEGRIDESGDRMAGVGLKPSANTAIIDLISGINFTSNISLLDPVLKDLNLSDTEKKIIGTALDESIKKKIEIAREKSKSALSLSAEQIDKILGFVMQPIHYEGSRDGPALIKIDGINFIPDYSFNLETWEQAIGNSRVGREGISELRTMAAIFDAAGYRDRIDVTADVVRGLEYYTGPVYECELTFPVTNEDGQKVRFGSVAGGGRYDGLVKRFTGQDVPATGFSIGVSRLVTALKNLGKLDDTALPAPVLVTVMDRDAQALGRYQKLTQQLREAKDEHGRHDIRAEMYQGNQKSLSNQLRYADRRGCTIAIIQGSQELADKKLQLKDLVEGRTQSEAIASNAEWRASRSGQFTIDESDLVAEVRKLLETQTAEHNKLKSIREAQVLGADKKFDDPEYDKLFE